MLGRPQLTATLVRIALASIAVVKYRVVRRGGATDAQQHVSLNTGVSSTRRVPAPPYSAEQRSLAVS